MADNMAYTAEKTLRENSDKVTDELKTEVESKIEAVRTALSGTDTEALNNATQALSESMQKLGTAVYEQAEPAPGAEEATGGEAGEADDGTVEGEFREV